MGPAPPLPEEQRSFVGNHGDDDATARLDCARPDRRDHSTEAPPSTDVRRAHKPGDGLDIETGA